MTQQRRLCRKSHTKKDRRGAFEGLHARARFDAIADINTLDGLRIFFANGDIAHIRPSGNAPQLRIYAVANTEPRSSLWRSGSRTGSCARWLGLERRDDLGLRHSGW